MAKNNKQPKKVNKKWTIAKTPDGTLQIIYTIPSSLIEKTSNEVLKEYAKKLNIPGFRKGKAPVTKVKEKIDANDYIQHTLSHILPELVGETIRTEKLKLAIYPKFELINAEDGKDWQVKALTCEIPDLKLGDYKKDLLGEARSNSLIVPGTKDKTESTKEEKDRIIINSILSSTKVDIPEILVDEEVNSRLSKLLDRIEKLGLSLDQYLTSVNKTAEDLRKEYRVQAKEALILDLVLLTIAEKEGIRVKESEVEDALKAAAVNEENLKQIDTPQQRNIIRTVLLKRSALDKLNSYL